MGEKNENLYEVYIDASSFIPDIVNFFPSFFFIICIDEVYCIDPLKVRDFDPTDFLCCLSIHSTNPPGDSMRQVMLLSPFCS